MRRIFALVLTIPFMLNIPTYRVTSLTGVRGYKTNKEQIESFISEQERYNNLIKEIERLEYERKRVEEEAERQRIIEEERIAKEQEELENKLGFIPYEVKEVVCKITYFFAEDSALQGGFLDKKGIPLKSHDYPIVALPSNVPYGSMLELDEPVRGQVMFKNVDTGGAIKWINDNTLKVDVFVKEATSYKWLINNTNNTTVTGKIYYKQE